MCSSYILSDSPGNSCTRSDRATEASSCYSFVSDVGLCKNSGNSFYAYDLCRQQSEFSNSAKARHTFSNNSRYGRVSGSRCYKYSNFQIWRLLKLGRSIVQIYPCVRAKLGHSVESSMYAHAQANVLPQVPKY